MTDHTETIDIAIVAQDGKAYEYIRDNRVLPPMTDEQLRMSAFADWLIMEYRNDASLRRWIEHNEGDLTPDEVHAAAAGSPDAIEKVAMWIDKENLLDMLLVDIYTVTVSTALPAADTPTT